MVKGAPGRVEWRLSLPSRTPKPSCAGRVAKRRGTSVTAAIRDALRTEDVRLGRDTERTLTPEEQADVDAFVALVRATAPKLRTAGMTMRAVVRRSSTVTNSGTPM